MSSLCYTTSLAGQCLISNKMALLVVLEFFVGLVFGGGSCWGIGRTYLADRVRRIFRSAHDLETVKRELEKMLEPIPSWED
jgi:membrane protein YqaA with SNARE-associated domain